MSTEMISQTLSDYPVVIAAAVCSVMALSARQDIFGGLYSAIVAWAFGTLALLSMAARAFLIGKTFQLAIIILIGVAYVLVIRQTYMRYRANHPSGKDQ